MRKILLLLILLGFSASQWPSVASAQQIRQLPANGKRGVTGNSLPWPQVAIGREILTMAPGGIIFDTNNRTIIQNSLPVGADVWYQMNFEGQVQRIYVLRPDEQTRLDQAKK